MGIRTSLRTGKMYSRTRLISHRPEVPATDLVCKVFVTCCSGNAAIKAAGQLIYVLLQNQVKTHQLNLFHESASLQKMVRLKKPQGERRVSVIPQAPGNTDQTNCTQLRRKSPECPQQDLARQVQHCTIVHQCLSCSTF